ncbi:hypothetical protein NPIL_354381 [Nephila pilipes]|uniref:Uncharacterized protein n=1 Tax=Nephila pilipes TaxID=299642 RepID=A0A8X6NIB5_NEPPI|nr:hypothetical protein NPIL_354381 [Nephila pilipes]
MYGVEIRSGIWKINQESARDKAREQSGSLKGMREESISPWNTRGIPTLGGLNGIFLNAFQERDKRSRSGGNGQALEPFSARRFLQRDG